MDNSVVGRRSLWGLVVAIVVVLVAGAVLPLEPGEPVTARFIRVYSAVAVALGVPLAGDARTQAFELGLSRPRPIRVVVTTLLVLVPLLGNGYLVLAQLRVGIVPVAGLLTTVAAAVGLGTVLTLSLRPVPTGDAARESARPGWRAAVPAGVAAGALALGVSAVPLAAEAVLVDGTTVQPSVGELDLPESLGRAAWTRELAWDVSARDAAPVAGGLALETDDSTGVVMLDGATGEERWSFHRSGTVVDELVPADAGRLLVVVHHHPPAGPWNPARTWSVLDATTGELLTGPSDAPPFAGSPGYRSATREAPSDAPVAGDVALGGTDAPDSEPRVAYSLRTGAELWRCEPADCAGVVAAEDAFVVTDGRRLRALDPRSGEELWATDDGGCGLDVLGVDEGVVVTRCGSSGDVVATDVATGEERWATALPDSGSYNRPVGVSHGAVNVRTTQALPDVPRLPASVTAFDRVSEDRLTVVLDVRSGEPRIQLPAGGYASALVDDVVVVADTELHSAAVTYDLDTGESTLVHHLGASDEPEALDPADGLLKLISPSCADLADGVHCPVLYDPFHVATLGPDGGVSVRRWSDLAVPDGLVAGPGLWAGDWDRQGLLPVPGGTVLSAAVGSGSGQQVIVGLVP
ncbi:PQQ-binding-like beta-propeller repeat protein [Georgenia phoenicis]|uniref:outer membrane protein assembly factor BamB family protein n=1 Tax=unclassified Georgenia TaxID=2626815 RepID=UPI0039B109AD